MNTENQSNQPGRASEEYAAIAMALYETLLSPHDIESNRLTIRSISTAWAFKPCLMPGRPVRK
ncbi:MAG: hypothetical protein ACOYJE_08725 [Bacteroidaceae bacterium]|jgi:hypothetical protein